VPGLEVNLGRFVLLADANHEAEVTSFAQRQGPALDQAYAQLEKLYGTSLTLPINIRLYNDWPQFVSLNGSLSLPQGNPLHTRVGSREIALIGPLPPGLLGSPAGLNMVRHEISGLFLDALAGGNLPPGLGLGLNTYVEFPGEQTEAAAARLRSVLPAGRDALLAWPDLLEANGVYVDRELATAQAQSMVAFLVDRYGFEALLNVVRGLGEGHSYRTAMAGIYGQTLEDLEAAWWDYLPGYVEGGWQHNAIYSFDLEPFEAALDAGAYGQTAEALDWVMPFLELTGQSGALAQAQVLREEARQGLAARQLTAELGQAIQAGNLEQALDLALQAQDAYAALGDTANASLAGAHADHLRQILSLREELTTVQQRADGGAAPSQIENDLRALVPKFQALGDSEGERQAIEMLNGLYAQQSAEVERRRDVSRQIVAVAGAIALALLALEGIRALTTRRREPRIL
jgi:hypothetical protein